MSDERAASRVYNVGETPLRRRSGCARSVVAVPGDRLPERRQELGYKEELPREEALRRTVEWERAHPPRNADPDSFDYAAEDAALAGIGR